MNKPNIKKPAIEVPPLQAPPIGTQKSPIKDPVKKPKDKTVEDNPFIKMLEEAVKVLDKKEVKKEPLTLYERLSGPVPEEFLITYTQSGKTFTGYHAQYAIDLLNKEVGLGEWFTQEKILYQEQVKNGWFVAMAITVSFRKATVTGYGAAHARRIEDVFKAAKTSAFKNACRYLGIGRELYVKGFEDDIDKEQPEKNEGTEKKEDMPDEAQKLSEKIKASKTREELDLAGLEIKKMKPGSLSNILVESFNKRAMELK